ALAAADDLLLARPAERIVHVPDELDLGVVCFRTGIAEEHFRRWNRCDLLELLGELDRAVVALATEQMPEGELAHLRRRGLGKLVVAPAQRRAPEPSHAVD